MPEVRRLPSTPPTAAPGGGPARDIPPMGKAPPVPAARIQAAVRGPRPAALLPGAVAALFTLVGIILLVALFYDTAPKAPQRPPFAMAGVLAATGIVAALLAGRILLRERAWVALLAGATLGVGGGVLAYFDLREVAKRTIPPTWGLYLYGLGALLALGVPVLVTVLARQGKHRAGWDRLAAGLSLFTALSYTLVGALSLALGTR